MQAEKLRDHTLPEGPWKFDVEVSKVFDNMLQRSIPQYRVMRRAVFAMACPYVRPNTAIIDLGCSRGEAIAELIQQFGHYHQTLFIGCEVSEPMLEACQIRFKEQIEKGTVDIRKLDLRIDYPKEIASVVMSVLTLMFIPIEHRQRLIKNIYDHLTPGGAFILVEKLLGSTASINELMIKTYHNLKSRHGYTSEEIERKRLSLEGVLVPVTARWNEELLRSAGFNEIDCFWRWMNFAAWIAVK